jgi:ADP-ribose pyrophosphatase
MLCSDRPIALTQYGRHEEDVMADESGTEDVYDGSLISVRVKTLAEPHGGTRRFEIVEHPDAVAIVALRDEAHDARDIEPLVALVRQERPAINKVTWEIPAGLIRSNERNDPEQAARRELFEETGYHAGAMRLLVREYPSPGFATEAISIYLAPGVRPSPGQSGPLDPTEIDDVRWLPLSAAQTLAARGEIEDGKTLLGLALTRETLSLVPTTPRGEAMPFDVTSPPFARGAPYRQDEASGGDATLKLENMLLEEFNYVSVTAYQAMEDRARLFNLYLLVIGIFGSGLAAIYQLSDRLRTYTQPLTAIALLVAGIAGVAFFLQLVRLRQAYLESLKAMNTIKEYYIEHFKDALPDPSKAFRWRLQTMPTGDKPGSLSSVVTHTVALLGSICFGGAAFVGNQLLVKDVPETSIAALGDFQPYIVGVVVAFVAFQLHAFYFRRELNSKRKR